MTILYSKRGWLIRHSTNIVVCLFYILLFLLIVGVFVSFRIDHYNYYVLGTRPLPDYITRASGINYSVETMEDVIASTAFYVSFLIIPFFTLLSPITIVGLIVSIRFTRDCYKNIAAVHDDSKHQMLLIFLNIFYMPFYYYRMKNKGWLFITDKHEEEPIE